MPGRTTPPPEAIDAGRFRLAVVAARFHLEIVERLVEGALDCLAKHGAPDVGVDWVPGSFELPLACRERARAADAVIALGCVVRGETPHFDYVAGECARGLMDAMLDTGTPIAFGVLTTETLAQAEARAGGAVGNKGWDAAETAIEMADLMSRLRSRRR